VLNDTIFVFTVYNSSEVTMVLSAVSAIFRDFKLSFTGFADPNTSSSSSRVLPLVSGTKELALAAYVWRVVSNVTY